MEDYIKQRRNNYRRMRNKLKWATDKAKEYLESIYDEIMEFQRTGLHDFMYIKMEE
jgi:malonyl CoA-acyl carrier protein transacylase